MRLLIYVTYYISVKNWTERMNDLPTSTPPKNIHKSKNAMSCDVARVRVGVLIVRVAPPISSTRYRVLESTRGLRFVDLNLTPVFLPLQI